MYQLPEFKNLPGIRHGISDISDGNMAFRWGEASEVRGNRIDLFRRLGIGPEQVVHVGGFPHNARIGVAAAGDPDILKPRLDEGPDAMVVSRPDIFLFLLTADCLPVMLYDPDRRVLALVHISRINVEQDLIPAILDRLGQEFGSAPGSLRIGIGPGVRPDSYVFTEPELAERLKRPDSWRPFLHPLPDGRVSLDLAGRCVAELVAAGADPAHMEVSPVDTPSDPGFFSHYRSVRTGEPEGRFATVVGMVEREGG